MNEAPHSVRRNAIHRSGRVLVVVFALVIGSFLGTSILAQYESSEIGKLSERLAENAAPSIESLASIRGAASEAELALARQLAGKPSGSHRVGTFQASLKSLEAALKGYLTLPLSPGERLVHDDVQQAWARFEEVSKHTKELADAGDLPRAQERMWRVERAADALIQSAMRAIEFNAQHGQSLADRIRTVRRRSIVIANALTAFCVLLGVAGALLLYRQARSWRALAEQHARGLEARAEELEQFAGRVAHDIRNPLSVASFASELIKQKARDQEIVELGARLARGLARANAITTDLLEFARSGAKPDPGARTSPREVIEDLAPELELEAAKNDIELRWGPVPPALVACSQGVYLSLLGNLVRNAIKYMGSSPTRTITVTVGDDGSNIRTVVEDTGPGVPERILPSLFEPYFRGEDALDKDGLGLGLPTVRRLAEGHNGSVRASSSPGRGSTFEFSLPRAGLAAATSHDDEAPVGGGIR